MEIKTEAEIKEKSDYKASAPLWFRISFILGK